jgi:crotonobetainyl-CoA:carnitine CoA-transferase CaiB-like acyl-CoA transferase
MNAVMKGIRVVELGQYVFVPVSTGVLAEWGADVIKVEHPIRGDAYRGLRGTGNLAIAGPVNYAIEHANRGKRSIGLDISSTEGRDLLGALLKTADVVVTNLLPESRARLRLEVEDVRADNPAIIYARGTALGERGPERNRGGYDHATFWARSGSQNGATPNGAERPSPMPSGAFGDSTAGLVLAGGIAAALLSRERTGEPAVVDLSLLGMGMWSMASAISGALMNGEPARPMERYPVTNPLAGTYRTQDDRWVVLGCLQGFAQWPDFCRCVGRPDWIGDPRFATADAFAAHGLDCARLLDGLFASAPLAHWREKLSALDAVWETVQDTLEVARDPQAVANGYVARVQAADDSTFELVASPLQFDETPPRPRHAPEAGQHTEEILLELGLEWSQITHLKTLGAIN